MHKKIVTDIVVRFKDVDSMGHVNNAVFFTYFEEGRKEYLRTLFNFVEPKEYNFILAHTSCDFFKPVRIGDAVSLHLWVGGIGRKKFDPVYRLVDRNDESIHYAEGRSVQIFFDYKRNVTLPIPRYFLDEIREYSDRRQTHPS